MPTAEKIVASTGIATKAPMNRGVEDAADRVDAHHLHGRELLARAHEADFSGERSARPAREEQRRHGGAELSHKGERDHGAERLLAAVGDEHVVALKAEHEAHEEARNRNDEKRVVADEVDLLNDVAEPCAAQPHQKRPREDPESADPAEESDHEAADCREELSHLSSPPKQASMLLAG
mgnify:CR=1 FL=1